MKQDTVSILGIASAIPSTLSPPDHLDRLARKFVRPSAALEKTIAVNHRTGIKQRPSVISVDDNVVNQDRAPKIDEINNLWMDKGMALCLDACEKAIADWGRPREEITHLICTTCTSSSHPGFDLHLLNQLPLSSTTERTLLHGIGCAGGVSLLRLARAQAIAAIHTPGANPPRILIVACEVTSTLVRAELELLDQLEGEKTKDEAKPNVAVTLFADAASAMIVGAGDLKDNEHASFDILNCLTESVPDTDHELGFDVHERGWRAILSSRVPSLTSSAVPPLFKRIMSSTPLNPSPPLPYLSSIPSDHDWLIHPGGAAVLTALTRVLDLNSPETDYSQTGPSWDIYRERGNSSSAAIGGVIERSRGKGGREGCVAVAFGPGISVEMAVLRRTGWKGRKEATRQTNGHTNGHANGNGHHFNGHQVNGLQPIGDLSVGLGKADCVCLRSARLFGGSGLDCWCRN